MRRRQQPNAAIQGAFREIAQQCARQHRRRPDSGDVSEPTDKGLTPFQRLLVRCARLVLGDRGLQWKELIERIGRTDFQTLAYGLSWETFIPESLERKWRVLPPEYQVIAFLVANEAANTTP
jgi:hypothetical protein